MSNLLSKAELEDILEFYADVEDTTAAAHILEFYADVSPKVWEDTTAAARTALYWMKAAEHMNNRAGQKVIERQAEKERADRLEEVVRLVCDWDNYFSGTVIPKSIEDAIAKLREDGVME